MTRDLRTDAQAHAAMSATRIVPLSPSRRVIREPEPFWPSRGDVKGWALCKFLFAANVALYALLAWQILTRHA